MIYLINPNEHEILQNAGDRMPIGLLSIASQLRYKGHNVKVFDLNHTSQNEFMDNFNKDKPEYTGISCYVSPSYMEATKLANTLKGRTKLIVGGYHATHMPESLVYDFDSVVVGEGETAFEDAIEMKGIIRAKEENLETLLPPAYGLLDMNKYGIDQSGNRAGTIITSRGCPFSCVFCGNMNRKIRYEPVFKVREMIKDLKGYGFKSLYFLDDIFTFNKERMDKILEGIDIPFRVTTRADLVNRDKIDLLKSHGCDWLSLGIESGNDEILKRARKGMTRVQNLEAIIKASRRDIKTKGFFIIGLPGETEETAKQTIDFSLKLRDYGLNKADFYFLTPFPGTAIWKNPEEFGIEITDRNYTKYLEAGKTARCYINTKELKAERIEEIVRGAKELWKD